jgi:hypothetical protein
MLTIKLDYDAALGKIAIGALKDGIDIILPSWEIGLPYLDKEFSTHVLGARLPRLPTPNFFNGFIWDFELHNIVLPLPDIELKFGLPRPSNVCGPLQTFFDDDCRDCDCGLLGCIRPGDCTNPCADPECSLCPNSFSKCEACDVSGNVVLDLVSFTCECVTGFLRPGPDVPCGMEGTELCHHLSNRTECEVCLPGVSTFFGGCKRCNDGFFLQPSDDTCMAKCPSGFTKNLGLRRTCDIDGEIGDIIL